MSIQQMIFSRTIELAICRKSNLSYRDLIYICVRAITLSGSDRTLERRKSCWWSFNRLLLFSYSHFSSPRERACIHRNHIDLTWAAHRHTPSYDVTIRVDTLTEMTFSFEQCNQTSNCYIFNSNQKFAFSMSSLFFQSSFIISQSMIKKQMYNKKRKKTQKIDCIWHTYKYRSTYK